MLSREFPSSLAEAEASSWRSHADNGAQVESQAGSTDDPCPEDMEFIEHDAALGVFRSPRPSITLDELQQQELRAKLLSESETKEGVDDAVSTEEGDEGAVCTKVWANHPSHTSLNSDKDRIDYFDLVVEDNDPWKPTVCQMGRYKPRSKKNGRTVYSPVFEVDLDSAEEQDVWGRDSSESQQQTRDEANSDVENDDEDDSDFEIIDHPTLDFSRMMAMD